MKLIKTLKKNSTEQHSPIVWIKPIIEDPEVLSKRDRFYCEMQSKALEAGGKGIIGKPCNNSMKG